MILTSMVEENLVARAAKMVLVAEKIPKTFLAERQVVKTRGAVASMMAMTKQMKMVASMAEMAKAEKARVTDEKGVVEAIWTPGKDRELDVAEEVVMTPVMKMELAKTEIAEEVEEAEEGAPTETGSLEMTTIRIAERDLMVVTILTSIVPDAGDFMMATTTMTHWAGTDEAPRIRMAARDPTIPMEERDLVILMTMIPMAEKDQGIPTIPMEEEVPMILMDAKDLEIPMIHMVAKGRNMVTTVIPTDEEAPMETITVEKDPEIPTQMTMIPTIEEDPLIPMEEKDPRTPTAMEPIPMEEKDPKTPMVMEPIPMVARVPETFWEGMEIPTVRMDAKDPTMMATIHTEEMVEDPMVTPMILWEGKAPRMEMEAIPMVGVDPPIPMEGRDRVTETNMAKAPMEILMILTAVARDPEMETAKAAVVAKDLVLMMTRAHPTVERTRTPLATSQLMPMATGLVQEVLMAAMEVGITVVAARVLGLDPLASATSIPWICPTFQSLQLEAMSQLK